MIEWKEGMLARTKAGHDCGELFVIIRVEPEYVYLVDGCSRGLTRPKKKSRKHVQVIYHTPFSLVELFSSQEGRKKISDETVKKAIKDYKKSVLTERV